MNDKQKDIALEMAVVRARMSMEHLAVNDYTPLKKELTDLLAAFDAAADPPKRKPTTADIEKPKQGDDHGSPWYRIRCREFVWTGDGWQRCNRGYSYTKNEADVIYAGLVATGNVPEVGE